MQMISSYKEVKEKYPREVLSVIEEIRSSRSKNKNINPDELKWFFHWSEKIENSGSLQEEQLSLQEEQLSLQEKIRKRIDNSSCYLCASKANFQRSMELYEIPKEIIDEIIDQEKRKENKKIEFESFLKTIPNYDI